MGGNHAQKHRGVPREVFEKQGHETPARHPARWSAADVPRHPALLLEAPSRVSDDSESKTNGNCKRKGERNDPSKFPDPKLCSFCRLTTSVNGVMPAGKHLGVWDGERRHKEWGCPLPPEAQHREGESLESEAHGLGGNPHSATLHS